MKSRISKESEEKELLDAFAHITDEKVRYFISMMLHSVAEAFVKARAETESKPPAATRPNSARRLVA